MILSKIELQKRRHFVIILFQSDVRLCQKRQMYKSIIIYVTILWNWPYRGIFIVFPIGNHFCFLDMTIHIPYCVLCLSFLTKRKNYQHGALINKNFDRYCFGKGLWSCFETRNDQIPVILVQETIFFTCGYNTFSELSWKSNQTQKCK